MRSIVALACIAISLAGCAATGNPSDTASLEIGPGIQPIPGSITYRGQPRTKLTKSPVGSPVPHEFRNERGERVRETYIIQPDRSLKLVNRRVCRLPFCDD